MMKKLFRFFTLGFLIVSLGLLIVPKVAYSNSIVDGGNTYTPYGSNSAVVNEVDSKKKDPVFKKTFLAYMEEYSDACWFCDVFIGKKKTTGSHTSPTSTTSYDEEGSIYGAINKVTKTLFNDMSSDFLKLLGIGVLFFLIFKVGKMLVQLQEVDIMQFLNDLLKPLGRAIIAAALLGVSVASGHQTIFYLLMNPVMDASVRIGEKILETTLGEVQVLKTNDGDLDKYIKSPSQEIKWSEINDAVAYDNGAGGADKPIEKPTKLMLLQWMKSVSSSFIVGIALGGSFVAVGIDNFFSAGGLSMTLAGLIIWGGFWVIYLMFPFKIIDSFVRIAFVFALMPLWIILWVFPATQGYTKKAWEMFLSACLLFAVLSIMIAISLMLISNVVPDTLRSANGSISRSQFFQMLCTEDTLDNAVKYAGFGSGLCMNALAFTAMSFSLISAASGIANSFVGGGGNIQTNVGAGMAGSIAQAGRAGWAVTKAGGKVGAWAASKGHDMWTNRGSKHTPTGTFGGARNTGNAGTNGNNGGDTPPPNPPPSNPDIPNPGRQQSDTRSSEGTNVRYNPSQPAYGQLPPEKKNEVDNRASTQESAVYDSLDDPTKRRQLMDTAGPEERRVLDKMAKSLRYNRYNEMDGHRQALREAVAKDLLTGQGPLANRPQQQAGGQPQGTDGRRQGSPDAQPNTRTEARPNTGDGTRTNGQPNANADLTNMTPERAKAVQELAKDAAAPQKFEKLSADVAFIEQSLSLKPDEFRQAISNHTDWQSGNAREMQSFAERLYSAKDDRPNEAEHAVKSLLDTHLQTTAGWNTRNQIATHVGDNIKAGNGPGRVLSEQLHALSLQITAARTNGSRR